MSYTLGEAAKATGKSKMTIQRAIKKGQISAKRLEDGSYAIDPSELHRVFQSVSESVSDTGNMLRADAALETTLLQLKLENLLEKIATLEAERDRERWTLQATIDDLRRRLDAEAQERGRLTLLLTDQRAAMASKPAQRRFAWVGLVLIIGLITGLVVLAMVFRESLRPLISG